MLTPKAWRLAALHVPTTCRSRFSRRLVRHRNDHWAMLKHWAAVPANSVSYAQDEPKRLRQACAPVPLRGEDTAGEFLHRAEG